MDQSISRVKDYVSSFKEVRDLQFETVPYDLDSHEGISYLLLVASINQSTSAEHVRDLMRALYDSLGDDLLRLHDIQLENYQSVLDQFKGSNCKIWSSVPKILSSASKLIEKTKEHGGFVERGKAQKSTLQAANRLANNIYYMGKRPGGARKKVWMFLRWMVRPSPDVGIWSTLDASELRVPLDTNTGRAFQDLTKDTSFHERVCSVIEN